MIRRRLHWRHPGPARPLPEGQIVLVPAGSTSATDGLDLALAAIVDQALAQTLAGGLRGLRSGAERDASGVLCRTLPAGCCRGHRGDCGHGKQRRRCVPSSRKRCAGIERIWRERAGFDPLEHSRGCGGIRPWRADGECFGIDRVVAGKRGRSGICGRRRRQHDLWRACVADDFSQGACESRGRRGSQRRKPDLRPPLATRPSPAHRRSTVA